MIIISHIIYYYTIYSVFEHDPSKVAVCRAFLQNRCTDTKCLLSHLLDKVSIITILIALYCIKPPLYIYQIHTNKYLSNTAVLTLSILYIRYDTIQSKMPDCEHYSKGLCFKVDCPYRHVKLSDNTVVCEDFNRGYCVLGTECTKKHAFTVIQSSKSILNNHENTAITTTTTSTATIKNNISASTSSIVVVDVEINSDSNIINTNTSNC